MWIIRIRRKGKKRQKIEITRGKWKRHNVLASIVVGNFFLIDKNTPIFVLLLLIGIQIFPFILDVSDVCVLHSFTLLLLSLLNIVERSIVKVWFGCGSYFPILGQFAFYSSCIQIQKTPNWKKSKCRLPKGYTIHIEFPMFIYKSVQVCFHWTNPTNRPIITL